MAMLDLANTPDALIDPVARIVEAALAVTAELLARWPGDTELLIRELELRGGPAWPRDLQQRRGLLDALTRGLTGTPQ